MLQIRFLQTGGWNLGSPVVGLSDSPDWLSRTAASAVRQSIHNVFQTAVAAGCHFVLATDRLASRENFPAAAAWLKPRIANWRRQGVRLLVAGHQPDEWPTLESLGAVVVREDRVVYVSLADGEVICGEHAHSGSLLLDCHGHRLAVLQASGILSCSARAVSGGTPAESLLRCGEVMSGKGRLQLATGSPQGVSGSESGAGCCAIVTADFVRGELTAQGYSPQVLQFVSAKEECASGTTLPQLLKRLAERHRNLPSGRAVHLVDWEITGRLRFSLQDDASLRESNLLDVLRGLCNAGHSGSWPYRLRFSEDCVVEVCERSSRLVAGILGTAAAARGLVPGSGSGVLELLHQLQRAA